MMKLTKIVFAILFIGITCIALFTSARIYSFYQGPSEATLAETGFLIDENRARALDAFEYEPIYPFWSDGSEKSRFLYLPPGTQIDNSNPDRWNFPKGTRIWKVFYRKNVQVETRMLFKYGGQSWEWDMAVYKKDSRTGQFKKLAFGKSNVSGTNHDIPSPEKCVTCHGNKTQRRPLGITTFQIPWEQEGRLSMTDLIDRGLLSTPPQRPYKLPGNDLETRTLGYLNSNCGSCHYRETTSVPRDVPLEMDLTTTSISSIYDTNVYKTAIQNQPLIPGLGVQYYISPGDPHNSYVWRRMSIRDNGGWQMPPIATEEVDIEGAALIAEWIRSLETNPASEAAQ